MKKMRHNKKRNTLFLFEILVQEMTKCITAKDERKKLKVLSIIKEFFSNKSELKKDRDLLNNIVCVDNMSAQNIERLLFHTKEEYAKLNSGLIFEQQSKLIKTINRELGSEIFKSFVQDYKRIATVHQFFNADLSPKQKVLLEQRILKTNNVIAENNSKELVHIDKLVFAKFVDNFNEKYSGALFEEQTKLLSHYISSFTDNGLSLKIFINEEIARITDKLQRSLDDYEIKENSQLESGIYKIIENVKNFAKTPVNENMLKDIINLQQLIRELNSDDG